MAEFNLMINEQERGELLRLLKSSLGETRVEVHRTHTPGFRENVKKEEEVIRRLLDKIQALSTNPGDRVGKGKTVSVPQKNS